MSSCRPSPYSILIASAAIWPATPTGSGVKTCSGAFAKGWDTSFQGERKTVWSGNWNSVLDNGSVVRDYLAAEVALRRKAGPFNQLPFENIC